MVSFPRRSGRNFVALVAHLLMLVDAYEQGRSELLVVKAVDSDAATKWCARHGYRFVTQVFDDENYYLFRRPSTRRWSRKWTSDKLGRLSVIEWSSRQSVRTRVLRNRVNQSNTIRNFSMEPRKSTSTESDWTPSFNDPLFKDQWYLHNVGQTGSLPGHDINVLPVWRAGLTGRGVAISVLDDGVHARSEEVSANYESSLSEEYLFQESRSMPVPENSHGTRCAAVAAGVANNGVCGVGVAYEARIGGVRILDGPLTDVQEALALVHSLDSVDVYTASWGPTDDGRTVDGPRVLARMAFRKGVEQGRGGKGSIYVWAAGNGGGHFDHCSLDGYASSPYTLTIGALTEDGRSAFYSEPCPALIAAVYVGGRAHTVPRPYQWTVDRDRPKVVVPEGRGRCGTHFQGTSAAAPMAAGVVALALQANPELTWRDVQHLVISTSVVPTPPESGWLTNAAGFRFHPKVGSGALDARALVEKATRWTTVPPLRIDSTVPDTEPRCIPPEGVMQVAIPVFNSSVVDRLETVITTVSIRHLRRGQLELFLTSPGRTTSQLLDRRPLDEGTGGFKRWDFVTLHFWGEDPEGVWTLAIFNHHPRIEGSVDYVSLTLHGT